MVARPSCSYGTTLLHIQLFCGYEKQLFRESGKQLLCEVGKISHKVYLLSRYNAVADLTALQGRKNWLKGLSALIVHCCYTLNCSLNRKTTVLSVGKTTALRSQGNWLQGPPAITIKCCCRLNCSARLRKLVAKPICSYRIALLQT